MGGRVRIKLVNHQEQYLTYKYSISIGCYDKTCYRQFKKGEGIYRWQINTGKDAQHLRS